MADGTRGQLLVELMQLLGFFWWHAFQEFFGLHLVLGHHLSVLVA